MKPLGIALLLVIASRAVVAATLEGPCRWRGRRRHRDGA